MDETQRQFLRRLTLKSYYHFIEIVINSTIPDNIRLPLKPFHKRVLDFCQDDAIFRKGVLMPRYFGKSWNITQSKPVWDYLHNPDVRVLIVAETHNKAKDFLHFTTKQIEENETLHYLFPETVTTKEWRRTHRWSSEEVEMPRKGIWAQPTFKCAGVGASIQGYHGDIIYLDDLIGKNAMMSSVIRHDTERWFSNVEELLHQPDPRGQNPSYIYLIGTHWAPSDLYCKVQDTDPDYKWIKIKAEVDGIATWPEKLSAEEIADMKADPERVMVFYSQMQNDPKSTDLTDFKEEYLQYYTREVIDKKECVCFTDLRDRERVVPIRELDIKATIDPAFSESGLSKTSRTAIVLVGVHRETQLKFVLEAWAKRITQPKQLYEKVEEYHLQYRPRRWGIEAFQAQAFILKAIREYMMEKHLHLPITALPKDVGRDAKELRIRSLLDEFGTGQIYIHKMMKDFIAEYLAFPVGVTKDILDALAYQKTYWTRVDHKKLEEQSLQERGRFMYEVGQRRTGY